MAHSFYTGISQYFILNDHFNNDYCSKLAVSLLAAVNYPEANFSVISEPCILLTSKIINSSAE